MTAQAMSPSAGWYISRRRRFLVQAWSSGKHRNLEECEGLENIYRCHLWVTYYGVMEEFWTLLS